MSLLPDDSLNHNDYRHHFRPMVGVTSSSITLSMILGLGYTTKGLWRRQTGIEPPLLIQKHDNRDFAR
jgi:hypothetical protein